MKPEDRRRMADTYRRYRDDGSKRWAWNPRNPGNQAIRDNRLARSCRLLREVGLHPVEGLDVLEVGCGSGAELEDIRVWGEGTPRRRIGVDLLPERWGSVGADQTHPVRFVCADGASLPFATATFDLVLLLTVVSSILDAGTASALGAECTRVLRPGGAVLWYDLRRDNPWNPDVRGIGADEVRLRFPRLDARLESTTVLPPLARRLGIATRVLYPALDVVPFLRTHLVGVLRRPPSGSEGR